MSRFEIFTFFWICVLGAALFCSLVYLDFRSDISDSRMDYLERRIDHLEQNQRLEAAR